jgi:predicted HTH domain antitoxin
MDLQMVVNYPETLPDALKKSRAEFEEEARMAMAIKLFEMKQLSSGQAAELAGMNRVAFLMSLHRFGVAMIDYSEEELLADIANA